MCGDFNVHILEDTPFSLIFKNLFDQKISITSFWSLLRSLPPLPGVTFPTIADFLLKENIKKSNTEFRFNCITDRDIVKAFDALGNSRPCASN